jgi:hypothetical protein
MIRAERCDEKARRQLGRDERDIQYGNGLQRRC